jgi:hypothetical protein
MTKCWKCGKAAEKPFPGMEDTHVECACGRATRKESDQDG